MSSIFISILFIINFILLLMIVILFLRQNKLFELEKKQDLIVKEMEEVVSSFLLEIKEDNENFIRQFRKINTNTINIKKENIKETDVTQSLSINDEKVKSVEGLNLSVRKNVIKSYKQNTLNSKEENDTTGINDIQERPVRIESKPLTPEEEILELHNKGLTFEEIAKKLNKGKTEVELMLKFRQKSLE